jgi:hypothetical protein
MTGPMEWGSGVILQRPKRVSDAPVGTPFLLEKSE